MNNCYLQMKQLKKTALWGAAILLAQLLLFRQYAVYEMENVELSTVAGHAIVLDAGHGGIDSGAEYGGLREKDINLAVAKLLGDILVENGAEVIYTRETDCDYYGNGKGGKRRDLLKRIDIINAEAGELFVSIHCNASREERWYGAQVYYSARAGDISQGLAENMQELLRKFPPNNKRQAKSDDKILILQQSKKPGVLVELGFLSNHKEAELLRSSEYQQKLAAQLARAVACHFK